MVCHERTMRLSRVAVTPLRCYSTIYTSSRTQAALDSGAQPRGTTTRPRHAQSTLMTQQPRPASTCIAINQMQKSLLAKRTALTPTAATAVHGWPHCERYDDLTGKPRLRPHTTNIHSRATALSPSCVSEQLCVTSRHIEAVPLVTPRFRLRGNAFHAHAPSALLRPSQ